MKWIAYALIAALLSPSPAFADDAHHKKGALADGEIRKVDKDAKKITIRHGPMPDLDMPAMTMVFQVKDPAWLDKVKAGDKIKFRAEKLGGAFTVTGMEPAK
jgi:Cu(I)/Ag(I) efflux system periplasmic protein CusF